MNWSNARALAQSGLHVRRESWPTGRWLIYQRGVAWFFNSSSWRVVTAGDFALAEWQASDWTAIPPELAACPTPPPPSPDPAPSPNPNPSPDPDTDPDPSPDPNEPPDPDFPPVFPIPVGPTPVPPPPSGPTPPPPNIPPTGCVTPTFSCTAAIYCDNPENSTSKRIVLGATLTGGNGTWSLKARIGTRLIPLGLVSAPGSASADTFVNCQDESSVSVYFTATGFGNCNPQVLTSTVTTECVVCDDGPICFELDCYLPVFGKSVGHCGADEVCATTVTNPFPIPAICTITGGVDDELLINGSPVDPGCCVYANGCNGAHEVNYTFSVGALETFSLAAGDNHGGGSGYGVSVCFTITAPPP